MFRKTFFLIFVLVVLSFNVYAGDIPRVIIHQGYLTDTNGNPVNGNVNISFGIYDVESGGTALLEEDIGSVNIKDGFYALEIGKNVNLMSLFADKYSLYLEVRINNEALTPRQRIGSVPFAFTAYDAVGDIHPRSIYVNGKLLIDETGKWVGDASTIPGVKSITAASPLTGGTITDTGTIGISKADAATDGYLSKDDFALFFNKQNRITGVCPNGTCVKKINEDGTVECDLCGGGGGSVSISAGTGIVVDPNPIVGIGTVSIDRAYLDSIYVLKGETSAITGAMIADGSITGADIADNSIPLTKLSRAGCTNGQVVKYYVEQPGVEYFMCDTDNTGITSCNTCDSTFVNEGQVDSITTVMVKDGAITKEKINASNCSNGQILKYSSASGKWECASDETGNNVSITGTGGIVVNPDPITGMGTISLAASYQDGSAYDSRFVNEGQVNSITSAMITDGTITGADIANGTITLSKLNKSGCTNGQVVKYYVEQPGVEYFMCDTDNTGITSCNTCDSTFVNEGQANSITSAMIVDGTITNSDIANSTIQKEKLNQSGCTDGQVLKYSSTTSGWVCSNDNSSTYTAGTGLSLTGTTFSVKNNVFQCANSNESIKSINIDTGAVSCEVDDNSGGTVTQVNTGSGLTGGPITTSGTISLASNYVDGSAYDSRFVNEGQTNSITSAMITDGTITGADIANGTITLSKLNKSGCSNGQVIKYYVEQPGVEYFMCDTDNTGITSCNTCDSTFVNEGQTNSITSAMIVDGTITNSDLSTGSYPNITGVGTLGSLTVSGNTYLATSSGNVGIGTTSPSKLLHLYRSSNLSGNTGIKLTYNFTGPVNGDRSSEWEIYAKSTYGSFEIANAGGVKLHIDGETEYVGIGNTSPTQKLDVTGNIRASGQLISGAATGTPPLSVSSTTQVNNLNADMVDSWHAAVHLSGLQDNLYGTTSTNWVELSRWAVDFDSVPGTTLRGIGFVSSSAGSIAGRIRFLVNGSQVGSDCTFTATTTITALNCPVITYTKPSGIGYIQIQIRRDAAGAEYVYYGYNTVVLK